MSGIEPRVSSCNEKSSLRTFNKSLWGLSVGFIVSKTLWMKPQKKTGAYHAESLQASDLRLEVFVGSGQPQILRPVGPVVELGQNFSMVHVQLQQVWRKVCEQKKNFFQMQKSGATSQVGKTPVGPTTVGMDTRRNEAKLSWLNLTYLFQSPSPARGTIQLPSPAGGNIPSPSPAGATFFSKFQLISYLCRSDSCRTNWCQSD